MFENGVDGAHVVGYWGQLLVDKLMFTISQLLSKYVLICIHMHADVTILFLNTVILRKQRPSNENRHNVITI